MKRERENEGVNGAIKAGALNLQNTPALAPAVVMSIQFVVVSMYRLFIYNIMRCADVVHDDDAVGESTSWQGILIKGMASHVPCLCILVHGKTHRSGPELVLMRNLWVSGSARRSGTPVTSTPIHFQRVQLVP